MNTTSRTLALACLVMLSSPSFAQQVTLGHLLEAEAQLTLKKMHEELNRFETPRKSEITLPPIAPIAPPKPATLSVYGTDSKYEAEVQINGATYSVRAGNRVDEYTVDAITVQGVELSRYIPIPAKRRKKNGVTHEKETVFAPLNIR